MKINERERAIIERVITHTLEDIYNGYFDYYINEDHEAIEREIEELLKKVKGE